MIALFLIEIFDIFVIMAKKITKNDIKIMTALQEDCSQSLESIAEKIDISPNTCWRRVKYLEEIEHIERRVALINPLMFGLGLTVFVMIKAGTNSKLWIDKFTKIVNEMPEIVEVHRLAGDYDYHLKMTINSVGQFDRIYQHIVDQIEILQFSATFGTETVKYTTELPLSNLLQSKKY